MKNETLKSKRENALYTSALLLHGNGKLLDYTDENGNDFRYAQANTRAVVDCPFRSKGCEKVCYATKGKHNCPDVKSSRERSYNETRRADFTKAMIYTIETEKTSKRYANAVMLIRIHESGDFYSVQYLRKWLPVWEYFTDHAEQIADGPAVRFPMYTKSFPFFNMLTDDEIRIIDRAQRAGVVAISASTDDTTTTEQKEALLKMLSRLPMTNIYHFSEKPDAVRHDNVCDCADCAKCGVCNKATGKTTVVKLHSASKNDIAEYRKNVVA